MGGREKTQRRERRGNRDKQHEESRGGEAGPRYILMGTRHIPHLHKSTQHLYGWHKVMLVEEKVVVGNKEGQDTDIEG